LQSEQGALPEAEVHKARPGALLPRRCRGCAARGRRPAPRSAPSATARSECRRPRFVHVVFGKSTLLGLEIGISRPSTTRRSAGPPLSFVAAPRDRGIRRNDTRVRRVAPEAESGGLG